ncbi:MAG: hypothetical protein R3F42_11540 [Pseudomonadota bacterium]
MIDAATTGAGRVRIPALSSRPVCCAPGQRSGPQVRFPACQAGLSYVEVLVATVLIMVALAPALEALAPGVAGAGIHAGRVEEHYALAGRLEALLAEPFADLDAAAQAAGSATVPSSYSDSVLLPSGRRITRNVYLSRYDGDNADGDDDPFTGTEDDLLWVRVAGATSGVTLETLLSAYD